MKLGEDSVGIAGAFEELPVILVVLVAVSLFSVSVAHATTSWDDAVDYATLHDDCLAFSDLVRASHTLCKEGEPGTYSMVSLRNFTDEDFLGEFNTTTRGIGYLVCVQCLDCETGNITLNKAVQTSEIPAGAETATFNSCINVDMGGKVGAARLTVTIWRDDS